MYDSRGRFKGGTLCLSFWSTYIIQFGVIENIHGLYVLIIIIIYSYIFYLNSHFVFFFFCILYYMSLVTLQIGSGLKK